MPIGMQGSFNLVDVRDLAAGTIAAADRGRKGECYILSNDEVSLKGLCEMLKAVCFTCRCRLPILPPS
jgi:dihydroflavonol-4-reductase